MADRSGTFVLLLTCPDAKGIVARISGYLYELGANIVHADQHTDPDAGYFFVRVEWERAGFALGSLDEIDREIQNKLAGPLGATASVYASEVRDRVAIFVTRQEHCVLDLLMRAQVGDLPMDVAVIVGNRPDLEWAARQYGIPFELTPFEDSTKAAVEARQLEILARHRVDLVVLAKYMRIVSSGFIDRAPRAINIHHSFLPAFVGANPYRQAFDRGVKIIGATAHYVTADLDQGPIIEQSVVRVSHRDTPATMQRDGKDVERTVLARAVALHLGRRVLVHGNKTVVFE